MAHTDPQSNITEEVSMLMTKLLPRLPLLIACSAAMAACSPAESLVAPEPVVMVRGQDVSRGGVEGLLADIAWARSLPIDIQIGNSSGASISRDALIEELEAVRRNWPGITNPLEHSPSLTLSPIAATRDISPGDVGGAGTMMHTYDSGGFRYAKDYAYTSCSQGSMVVAKIELDAKFYDWATGAEIGSWYIFDRIKSSPNYISHSAEMGIGGTATVRAQGHNKHTCEIGTPGDYPYKYSDPSTIF